MVDQVPRTLIAVCSETRQHSYSMYHVSSSIFQQAPLQKVMQYMVKYMEVYFCDTVASWAGTKHRGHEGFSRDSGHGPAQHCDHVRIRPERYEEAESDIISQRAYNVLASLSGPLSASCGILVLLLKVRG